MKQITNILLALILIPSFTVAQLENNEILENLKSISSKNDFIQQSLSSTSIDSTIYSLITAQVNIGTLNEKIEIPFNHQKLEYLGFMHPNETNLFKANPISAQNNNTPELDKKLYIFKYEDFYVSLESKNNANILNLYYTLRAINIIKIRYPELYKNLFINSMEFKTKKPKYGNWVNSNKAFWIAFNTNPKYIASNNTIFLKDGFFSNSQVEKYRNIALVNIDSENILGKSETIGSRPLYNKKKNSDNHLSYLRDGLIESIAHEMIHNYIDLAYTYNKSINEIKQNRGKLNFVLAEEIAVLNTSLPYFIKKGGLNKQVISYYYKNIFDYNIGILKKANLLNSYGAIFTKEFADNNWKTIFKLNILD
ncbi:hypothetical protein MKD41_06380 [Lutibacter sp. A64]|uniref:hypothetical protein n=1 Tax=Lutibacter sp. A64 TaxID=2918526 RepID=UPI001F063271|nr:hypothetical protein [Lutibacter sp. A64]UMB55098.1 hypothetical protein MKD41_06380 [Lutibacter sp. A64]